VVSVLASFWVAYCSEVFAYFILLGTIPTIMFTTGFGLGMACGEAGPMLTGSAPIHRQCLIKREIPKPRVDNNVDNMSDTTSSPHSFPSHEPQVGQEEKRSVPNGNN
jgi:hypothetical protein